MKVLALFYFAFIAKFCSAWCCCGSDGDIETLDILNPDLSKVTVEEKTSDGVKWKVFKPKKNVTITSFSEGRVEIAKTNSALEDLRISLDLPTPLLDLESEGLCTPAKYFETVGEDGKMLVLLPSARK